MTGLLACASRTTVAVASSSGLTRTIDVWSTVENKLSCISLKTIKHFKLKEI